MFFGGVFRDQQGEDQVDRLAIRRIELHWLVKFDECDYGCRESSHPAMRYGNALAQAGAAKSFAADQRVKDVILRGQRDAPAQELGKILKDALFAGGFIAAGNPFCDE